jgi:hypothetical protein
VGGREGRHPWRGWHTEEAAALAPALVGEGRGKGDLRPVGRLSLLVVRRVGPKATGPKGRTCWRAAWPTGPKSEEETFSK